MIWLSSIHMVLLKLRNVLVGKNKFNNASNWVVKLWDFENLGETFSRLGTRKNSRN